MDILNYTLFQYILNPKTASLTSPWILTTGLWNDDGKWDDTDVWVD